MFNVLLHHPITKDPNPPQPQDHNLTSCCIFLQSHNHRPTTKISKGSESLNKGYLNRECLLWKHQEVQICRGVWFTLILFKLEVSFCFKYTMTSDGGF